MSSEMAIGVYMLSRAKWLEADIALRATLDAAGLVGDRRAVEEAYVHRAAGCVGVCLCVLCSRRHHAACVTMCYVLTHTLFPPPASPASRCKAT
jgi:hypothetical protein